MAHLWRRRESSSSISGVTVCGVNTGISDFLLDEDYDQTHPPGLGEGLVNVKKADGVLQRTGLKGRIDTGSSGHFGKSAPADFDFG